MIKEAINELDWRTYASAARKENDNERNSKFAKAAKERFSKQYNNGFDTDKYSIDAYDPVDINTRVHYSGRGADNHLSANIYNDYYWKDEPHYNASKNRYETGIMANPDIDIPDLKSREQYKKAVNDFRRFHKGKSHYNTDTPAWENDED
jgi:hypothetical protein